MAERLPEMDEHDSQPSGSKPDGSTPDSLREQIVAQLETCRDPEIGLDIMSLGLVYDTGIEDGKVHIKMTLTAIGCPWAQDLFDEVKAKVEEVPGVKECTVELVYSPPWSPEMMTDEARMELGFL
jgi:metal-sulfur cluster biosynthetic enzyme